MKKNLILSITSISSVLTMIPLATISCGNSVSNSEGDIIDPSLPPVDNNPSQPGGDETNPSLPPTEDNKPSQPGDDNSNPVLPPDNNPDQPTNPGVNPNLPITVESVKIISNIDKFEIQVKGENLIQNSSNYIFTNDNFGTKYMNLDITKSSSSEVILYTEDFAFQNQTWKVEMKNNESNLVDLGTLTFSDMILVQNLNNYVQYLYNGVIKYNKSLKDSMYSIERYKEIYNLLSLPENRIVRLNNNMSIVTKSIEVNYNNLSNNSSSFEYSVYFSINYAIMQNSTVLRAFNYTYSNPGPLNDCLSNVEYVTDEGIHFKGDTITGYTGTATSIVIKDRFEVTESGNRFISKAITKIADGAFENKGLKSVTFSSAITKIGDRAFANNSLEKIDFSNTNISSIGTESFWRNKITQITWNKLIKEVSASSFAYNNLSNSGLNLKDSNIEIIREWAFANNLFNLNIGNKSQNNIIDLPLTIKTLYSGSFEVDNRIDVENAPFVGTFYHDHSAYPHYTELYDYSKTDMGGPFFRVGSDLKEFWKTIDVLNLNGTKLVYNEILPNQNYGTCIRCNITSGIEFYNGRLVNEKFYGNQWDNKLPIPYS